MKEKRGKKQQRGGKKFFSNKPQNKKISEQ